jgi:uncharacterized protein YndB with AHSA1/START domain
MKWVWITLAVLAGLVLLLAVAGALLPVAHAAARRVTLRQPAAAVFAVLTDVAAMPSWRKDLKAVELLPPRDGKRCYREHTRHGVMDLLVEREEPPHLLVGRIVTEGSPFGGTWTFALSERNGATELTITENGEVYNVIFRALARFVFGHTSTIDGYLTALGARFGEQVVPVDAEPAPPPQPPR